MGYRIGELADFFDMTKEGVRYLEREGIIVSQRDALNGYRFFSRDQITRLKEIRSYQAMGFTLEEAADIVKNTQRDELLVQLDEKRAELTAKREQLERMLRLLSEQRTVVSRMLAPEDELEVVMRPEMYFFKHVSDEASGGTRAEREAIANARAVEKMWIQAMPDVRLWAKHADAQGNPIQGEYGSGATAEVIRARSLPVLPQMVHLEPCLCVHSVLETPEMSDNIIADATPLLDRIRTSGYEICGDVYGAMHVHFTDEDRKRWSLYEIYVPVCEKTSGNA